jgi:hypothetical protein
MRKSQILFQQEISLSFTRGYLTEVPAYFLIKFNAGGETRQEKLRSFKYYG